mmetsp:Transcript_18121/g.32947  ORF Transcript_18121/g.32947 Transcript_18121/m.32947 type:complete len:230 (+) Transcript_18121:158-847(+)
MIKSFTISLLLFAAGTSKAHASTSLNDLLMLSTSVSISDDAKESTCTRNSGHSMSFEGMCDSRDYTWTEQCNVEERDGQCITTANSCGCQVQYSDGYSSGIGSGSIKGCDNACVTISDDVPQDRTCQASGSGMSFEGSCASRNYTYTSACSFAEEVDDQVTPTKCMITANYCGCLWWEEDSEYISGLNAGSKNCDACAAHGYPLSSAPGIGLALNAFVVAAMSAAWFVL